MAERKKGKKINAAKAGSIKGRSPLSKTKAKGGMYFAKPNKDVFNRADESMSRMVGNKGIPRAKVGMRGAK